MQHTRRTHNTNMAPVSLHTKPGSGPGLNDVGMLSFTSKYGLADAHVDVENTSGWPISRLTGLFLAESV